MVLQKVLDCRIDQNHVPALFTAHPVDCKNTCVSSIRIPIGCERLEPDSIQGVLSSRNLPSIDLLNTMAMSAMPYGMKPEYLIKCQLPYMRGLGASEMPLARFIKVTGIWACELPTRGGWRVGFLYSYNNGLSMIS